MLFDFPYHTVAGKNPESSIRVQFGSSYSFSAPPSDPDQRIFTLSFPAMKYYVDDDGEIDAAVNPSLNMMRMLNFYYEHKLWKTFQYQHPIHGMMSVRFNEPIPEPESLPGGTGVVKGFDVQLIEIL